VIRTTAQLTLRRFFMRLIRGSRALALNPEKTHLYVSALAKSADKPYLDCSLG
jgi:hypothetical protein